MDKSTELKGLYLLWMALGVLLVASACSMGGQSLQILPTDDAFVDNVMDSDSFGSDTDLYIGNSPTGGLRRSYLKFDLSEIPAGSTITNAELVLTISSDGGSASDCNIAVHNVPDSSWSEGGTTPLVWNNAPGYDPCTTANVYFLCGSAYSFAWSVTVDVNAAFTAASHYSAAVKLEDEATDIYVVAHSKESLVADKPYLEVTYEPPGYILIWNTIDGGGGLSSGGTYQLEGTIGQPDTAYSAGGKYELLGGFWPGGPLCFVEFEDFARFAEHWLQTGCNESNNWCSGADLNHLDGVNWTDLKWFTEDWLSNCPYNWPMK